MRSRAAPVVGAMGIAVAMLATSAPGWAAGYDFFNAKASADGVSVQVEIDNLLPVNQLLGPSSGSTEAHISRGGIGSSAIAPNPGDLILSAPGAAAGLGGIPNLPQYPAQAQANYPATPSASFSLAPAGTVPAGSLSAEAGADGAESKAALGDVVQGSGTSGISVGAVTTHSKADRSDDSTYEASAESQIENVQLLGGVLQIAEITTSVTAGENPKGGSANPGRITVSGASLNGTPVAITDRGIEAPSGATALAPVVDTLVKPLAQQGFSVHTTPAQSSTTNEQAQATGAALVIEHRTTVNGYPALTTISLGASTASINVSGYSADAPAAPEPAAVEGASTSDQSSPATSPAGLGTGSTGSTPATPISGTRSALPQRRGIPVGGVPALAAVPIDFRSGYPPILAAGLFLLAAWWWVNHQTRPGQLRAGADLRSLWRW